MAKAAIGIASIGVGCALFALIAKIQMDPSAFTSKPNSDADVPAQAIHQPLDAEYRAHQDYPEVLPLVAKALAVPERDSAAPSYATRPVVHENAQNPARTEDATKREWLPCSRWRDLGPKLGHIDGVDESRHVRQLC